MQCEYVQQRLNALADGELNRWLSRRIQGHLHRCRACSEEYAAIRQIGEQARAWREANAPNALRTRLRQTLTEAQASDPSLSALTEERNTMNAHNIVLTPPRNHANNRLGWRPIAALGAVGVMLVVTALFLTPTRKSFAFAAVLQAMQRVRTIHWTVKTDGFTLFGQENREAMTIVQAWARLDDPAYALLIGEQGEVKMLLTPQKQVMVSEGKVMMEMPMSVLEGLGKDKKAALRAFIIGQLVSPKNDAAGARLPPDLMNVSGLEDRFQKEEVVLDGKRAVRFSRTTPLGEGLFTVSFWVDPDTQLVLQSETKMPNPVKGQPDLVSVATQFRYNEEPPAGIFDLPTK